MNSTHKKDQKIVFFDIDGTLVPEKTNYITESALSSIRQMQKNGHLAFINTGRTTANLDDYIVNAGFDGFICACGTYIIYEGETIFYHHTEDEVCKKVVALAEKYHMDLIVEAHHGIYCEKEKLRHPEAIHLASVLTDRKMMNDHLGEKGMNFDKFITWANKDSEKEAFIRELAPYYDHIDRGGDFSEYVPHGFSKATGIQYILNRFELPLDNAYAVGDSNNDLPMLSYVPHSIAMGNTKPESLKELVEYVTDDIDRDGIKKALAHYGLI